MGTTKSQEGECSFACRDGPCFVADIEGKGPFYFWHNPAANKESPDVKERLQ
ncbi:MAG: hypothetical protein ACJ0UT_12380 [Candidatus Latescibacterota bacterium]